MSATPQLGQRLYGLICVLEQLMLRHGTALIL